MEIAIRIRINIKIIKKSPISKRSSILIGCASRNKQCSFKKIFTET